jgi:hypothetical protein
MKATTIGYLLVAMILLGIGRDNYACTIAVIGPSATADNRPLLWKNRDVGSIDQQFRFFHPVTRNGRLLHGYIGNFYRSDSTRIYMGANDAGFAIINSNTYNLGDSLLEGIDDGLLMRLALESCAKLADFERLLDSTDVTGRIDCWNFGVIDADGRAAVYECGNHFWESYYATPAEPVIVRANYSLCGGEPRPGDMRFKRATQLLSNAPKSRGITPSYLLSNLSRDIVNEYDNPLPLPYNRSQNGAPAGYVFLRSSINNTNTTSATVIRGVARPENPAFTLVYAILGYPVMSLAFPLWVGSQNVPIYLNGDTIAPIVNIVTSRLSLFYDNPLWQGYGNSRYLLDNYGNGVYSYTWQSERIAISMADSCQTAWDLSPPTPTDISVAQWQMANRLFNSFRSGTAMWVKRQNGQ